MNYIYQIYKELLKTYGPQGWWPVTPRDRCGTSCSPVYGIPITNDTQKFEIMVGAILTQNTSWKNVEKAISELNKKNLMSIPRLLKSTHEELASAIRSSGYFNQKAQKLRLLAEFLTQHAIKELQQMDYQESRKMLLQVKGIGPETADSILLYALAKPIFVVDAYTRRIFSRVGYRAKTYAEYQVLFMKHLDQDSELFNEYHALLVELAKNICRKKPVCTSCPIKSRCSQKI